MVKPGPHLCLSKGNTEPYAVLFVFSQLLNETSRNKEIKARPQGSPRVGPSVLADSFCEDQGRVSKQGRALEWYGWPTLTSLDTHGVSLCILSSLGPVKPTLLQESFSFLRQGLNSQRSTFLCLCAGIKGVSHHWAARRIFIRAHTLVLVGKTQKSELSATGVWRN